MFNNTDSPNATLTLSTATVATLSLNARDFLNPNNSMSGVTVRGDVVCNSSIRDEIASVSPSLMIDGEMSGLFIDGSAQCGDRGKLHKIMVIGIISQQICNSCIDLSFYCELFFNITTIPFHMSSISPPIRPSRSQYFRIHLCSRHHSHHICCHPPHF